METSSLEKQSNHLEPIVVRASLQLLTHPTEVMAAKHTLELQNLQLGLNRSQRKPAEILPKFVKTKHAAAYIDVDESFLTKKMGIEFFEDEHYFRPSGSSILRWDLEALEKWVLDSEGDEDDFVDKMFQ